MESQQVGAEVQSLYDAYPYPAHGIVSSVVPRLIAASLESLTVELGRRDLRVLDAGCGTGEQTLGLAKAYPELDVTGIDITKASLDFARNLGVQHGIEARFEHHDLSRPLPESLGTFDVITSIGVLHSLPDTPAGFRHVRAVARPHTLFLGMVYGTFGREGFYRIRDVLNMITPSRDEQLRVLDEGRLAHNAGWLHYLDTLEKRLRFGPKIDPVEAVRRVVAGRSAQYQADAYTHVKDTSYTWDELAELLTATGWLLEGWPERSGMPDRPEQLFRGRALELVRGSSKLEQARIYERVVRPGNLYFLARPA